MFALFVPNVMRAANAGKINDDEDLNALPQVKGALKRYVVTKDLKPTGEIVEVHKTYNVCKIPDFKINDPTPEIAKELAELQKEGAENCDGDAECFRRGTMWYEAFAVNSAWTLLMCINFAVMAWGGYNWTARVAGTYCNLLLAAGHILVFAFLITVRWITSGKACMYNEAYNTYEGDLKFADDGMTYKDDGTLITFCGFFQLVFWIPQCFCFCCPLLTTPKGDAVVAMKPSEGGKLGEIEVAQQ